jgi:hypothetical protein
MWLVKIEAATESVIAKPMAPSSERLVSLTAEAEAGLGRR